MTLRAETDDAQPDTMHAISSAISRRAGGTSFTRPVWAGIAATSSRHPRGRLPEIDRPTALQHLTQGGAPVHAGRNALIMVATLLVADLIGQLKLPFAWQPPLLRARDGHIPNRAELEFVRE